MAYSTLYDGWVISGEILQGYALYDAEGRVAILSPDGRLLSGYEYYYDYTDGSWSGTHCIVRNGYAISADKPITETGKNGVLNLRDGTELLPPIYDAIYLWSNCIVAVQDGHARLFSYAGEELYDFEGLAFYAPYDLYRGSWELRDAFPDFTDRDIHFYIDAQQTTVLGYDRWFEFIDDWLIMRDEACEPVRALGLHDKVFANSELAVAVKSFAEDPYDLETMHKDTLDIYSTKTSKLLRENVLGYVVDPMRRDRLVVYTAPDTCELLYADGRSVNIPIHFTVERIHTGC